MAQLLADQVNLVRDSVFVLRADYGAIGHTLLASNRKDVNFDRVARELGAHQNSFPWG